MATAVGRNISYGAAYTEYAAKKDKAVFIGSENMVGDFGMVFDNNQLDDFWLEFKEAGADYHSKGKDVTRDLFVIEYSPTPEESKGWTKKDWFDHAKELLQEIDKVTLQVPKKDKKGKWILDENGKKKLFRVPKTHLTNSKWMAMLHRDSESGIYHLHILISRFTVENKLNNNFDIARRTAQAAETINKRNGWTQAMDIRQQHIDEINGVINNIMADMNVDDINLDDFKARVEATTYTDYKGRTKHYTIKLRPDENGNIGYSIGRGKSTFTATELGQKITNIPAERKASLKNMAYDVLRNMDGRTFDWNKFVRMMENNNRCQVNLKHDSKGNVVNYSVVFDGKTYTASQIGPKLTAKKIVGEWEHIRQEQEEAKADQERKAKVIPFVKVGVWGGKKHDGSWIIGISINGKKYPAKPLAQEHRLWYQQQTNQKQAMQDLLIHYFGDEIQKAQVENWKQQHFDAGKMPFGIIIGATYGTGGRMGDHFWLRGDFTQNGTTKLKSKEVSKEDFVKWRNGSVDDARAVVCNTVGRDLIKDWDFNPLSDIKKTMFESPADFSTTEGIEQSVRTFEAFTENLCNDFMKSCGEAAVAYFNAILPPGMSTGGGGGGQDAGGWRGKDDDEWWKRGSGIMGFHPPKKGSSGGRKI